MVSFSNGCVSGDSANKRPFENGYVPKYKPRKVSAVRDFPPMCGSNFMPVDRNPEQNGPNVSGIREGLGCKNSETTDAVISNGAAEKAEPSKRNDIKNSEVVGSLGVGNSNIGALCQSDTIRNNEDVDMAEQMDASVGIKPQGIEFPIDDAVNNPVEVERVESLDAMVGNVVMTTTVDGFLNNDENLITETEHVGVDKQNEIKNDSRKGPILSSQVLASSPGRVMSKTSTQPKDKYRQRRVSAVRDFPPNCGRIALPPESEKMMVNAKVEVDPVATEEMTTTSQKECLVKSANVHVKKETEILNDDGKEPPGEMMEDIREGESMDSDECNRQAVPGSGPVSDTSNENTENSPIRRETAASLPDMVWAPQSGFNTENELFREIVHALAAPNSQFRKGNAPLNSPDSGTKVRSQNLSQKKKYKAAELRSTLIAKNSGGRNGNPGSHALMDEEDNGSADDEGAPLITPISMSPPVVDSDAESTGKEIVVYSPGQSDEISHPRHGSSSADREGVHSVMTAPHPPWRKGKRKMVSSNPGGNASGEKKGEENFSWRLKAKAVAKKSAPKSKFSGSSSMKRSEICVYNDADSKADDHYEDFPTNPRANRKIMEIEVSLPPRAPKSIGHSDARNKVRETLRLFNAFCRKLLQQEESNSLLEDGKSGKKPRRIDLLSAKAIKDKGKEVNTEKQYIGHVPGVEVGDEFQYRVELAVVGIHRLYQAGIDSIKINGMLICTSIVSSGAYGDDVENADVLLYSGQGGNVVGKCKTPEDQKLEKGNLALYNSISKKNPVRVVRGWKEARVLDPLDPKAKMVSMYVYDGLYTVTRYWPEKGPHGKQVFMFELRRNPGQPELAWKELKKTNKFKVRPGMVVSDISGGKEPLAICAVNTFDDEKPPSFRYISKMMYPDWFKPSTPPGCDCIGRCSDSEKCHCAVRNGGEVPYNRNGAIVETKPLVYECGPHCKCPPSCYNRVTQRGIKFPLEIFKTKSRGWGVRALTSIPSGSFICEYAGELLEDKEAEKRIGNDEYLFDIGNNYSDASVMNEEKAALAEHAEGGYTIDAAQYGNVGRFINHSCSPNLYAQNVIYDHDDKRMPHVMLFAMENLPPLQELTYHYNYLVDEIRDSYGNIKVKECYCGSAECSGRMY